MVDCVVPDDLEIATLVRCIPPNENQLAIEVGWHFHSSVSIALQRMSDVVEAMLDVPQSMTTGYKVRIGSISVKGFKSHGVELTIHQLPERMANSTLGRNSQRTATR